MSSDELLNEKTLKKLDRKLQDIISRTGIEKKTLDEVFDKYTLLTNLFQIKFLILLTFLFQLVKRETFFVELKIIKNL